ncbi:MAG: N-6 DNA methylase, partial [Tissierellia bacterium]|nr:N-6 DNA methylase [Tissierellia bacterium]
CIKPTSFEDEDVNLAFQQSWSSNTKNFLFVDNESVKVTNWYDNKINNIKIERVVNDWDAFYKYLLNRSFNTNNDAVPFILDIFRQLRNITYKSVNSSEAINLLFYLLISLKENISNIDVQKWCIDSSVIPDNFEYFIEKIGKGVRDIKPDLDLILRHTSGALFQEAHREVVYFYPQRDLFGGVSNKLDTKMDAYSSIHYTPQYIARTIVENVIKSLNLNKKELTILDPTCGSAVFLVEILKQLKNLNYKGKIKIKAYDSSDIAVRTSRFLLTYENRKQWSNSLDLEILDVKDSLRENWGENDVVLMNPPFLSWELMKDKGMRDSVTEVLDGVVPKSRSNQASAFFYKACQSLSSNGVIGCVLPTSIFNADIYSKLRHNIQERLSINLVAKLGNFVFEDALTDVSLFTATNKTSMLTSKLIWTRNEKGVAQEALRAYRKINANNETSIDKKTFSIYSKIDYPSKDYNWRVVSLKENEYFREINLYIKAGKLSKVSDVFNVKQGALLGVKNVFKLSESEYKQLPNEEKQYFRPVLTNESIRLGIVTISEYIWYPYNKDGLIIENEEQLKELFFYENYLLPNEQKLKKRKGVKHWWALSRPRIWQFIKEPRLYSNRFGNSNSFAFDKKGVCVIEEGNAFLPKKKFTTDDYYFYLSCFSGDIFDKMLSMHSKQLAGGKWYDLGAKNINNIPIPNVHNDLRTNPAYLQLSELGKQLENGDIYVKTIIDSVLKTYFYPDF